MTAHPVTKTIALFTLLTLAGCSRGVTNAEVVRATAVCAPNGGINYIVNGLPHSLTIVYCADGTRISTKTNPVTP